MRAEVERSSFCSGHEGTSLSSRLHDERMEDGSTTAVTKFAGLKLKQYGLHVSTPSSPAAPGDTVPLGLKIGVASILQLDAHKSHLTDLFFAEHRALSHFSFIK